MTSKVHNSHSADSLSSIDYEIEQIDFTELREKLEKYFDAMLKIKLLSIDLLSHRTLKAKLLTRFMDSYNIDYVMLGGYASSMFENVVQCNINKIPMHSYIDIDHYFKTNMIVLLDDDEYLRQNLLLMKL